MHCCDKLNDNVIMKLNYGNNLGAQLSKFETNFFEKE